MYFHEDRLKYLNLKIFLILNIRMILITDKNNINHQFLANAEFDMKIKTC